MLSPYFFISLITVLLIIVVFYSVSFCHDACGHTAADSFERTAVIGTACIVCGVVCRIVGAYIYVTVACPSVCLSVCLSDLSTAEAACGGFAAGRSACRRYRSTAAGSTAARRSAANAGSVTFTAAVED